MKVCLVGKRSSDKLMERLWNAFLIHLGAQYQCEVTNRAFHRPFSPFSFSVRTVSKPLMETEMLYLEFGLIG